MERPARLLALGCSLLGACDNAEPAPPTRSTSSKPAPLASEPSKPPAKPAPTSPAIAPATTQPKTYRVAANGLALTITLTPPEGWTDQSADGRITLNTANGTWLKLSLTCHGACGDAKVAKANIERKAKEDFDFTKSDGHIPQLAPQWDQEVTEVSPGVFRYAFHGAAAGKDYEEHYVVVNRIVDGQILECRAELVRPDLDRRDAVVELCDELHFEKTG